MSTKSATIDPSDVARFSEISAQWWDEYGPFAPIHKINPVRLGYIKQVLCAHFGRDVAGLNALKGLDILDVGCGGGLACEPLSRLGANVTGIDADPNAIDAAQHHAEKAGVSPTYRHATSEDLATEKHRFDVVLALEIVEHVADVPLFIRTCADLCRPDGIVIVSTLNKTLKSMMMAKIAAEYILRWVPAGTHDWRKFLRPSALANVMRQNGLTPTEIRGLVFDPLRNDFTMSDRDLDVNYFIVARKEEK